MLRWMDGKSRINLWNWKESGIEKVQVLKGKGKEKVRKRKRRQGRDKARQGQGKARKFQRIERRKERTWKERTNGKSSSLGLSFLSFFSLLFLLIFDSRKRELRVNI